jgi:hypothetical protein
MNPFPLGNQAKPSSPEDTIKPNVAKSGFVTVRRCNDSDSNPSPWCTKTTSTESAKVDVEAKAVAEEAKMQDGQSKVSELHTRDVKGLFPEIPCCIL